MNGRLIGESGPAAGEELAFAEGESWTVGRDPDEAQLVVADPAVSRRHAICRLTPEGYLLENLSSTNPLMVNGRELLDPYLLQEGDRVKIGESSFRFTSEGEGFEAFDDEEEEEISYDTIFGEGKEPPPTAKVDLEETGRWLVKVITGPNTGAEIAMRPGRTYLMGTDAATCDVVFHDLSVSRQHARIFVADDETLAIEDLHSRNRVIIDGAPVRDRTRLVGNNIVALGTTSFVIIDREEAQETLISTPPPAEAPVEEKFEEALPPKEEKKQKPVLTGGAFILLLVAVGIIVIVVAGSLSLFKADEVVVARRDHHKELSYATAEFPDLRFSFNKATGKLFLLGHVLTPVDKSELFYNLQGLNFITEIDDNVVVDQYVWEEFNAIISKNVDWVGVSMYSPIPGKYVLSGYLERRDQAISLQDYLRVNFPYVDLLEDQVVVEEVLMEEVRAQLIGAGFAGVASELANGELTLSGYIGKAKARDFEQMVRKMQGLTGVRGVRNFVVLLADEQSVIDLTDRYKVQGFTRRNGTMVNVLVNGEILARGDNFQGMEVVSIKSNAIILEKNGVKYKISFDENI